MGWWLTAKPGDCVVCVDDHWREEQLAAIAAHNCTLPIKGKIYTLRQIGYSEFHHLWLLRLVEIVNPRFEVENCHLGEPTFNVRRFRPLIRRPTDISIFKAMLTGQPAKADA